MRSKSPSPDDSVDFSEPSPVRAAGGPRAGGTPNRDAAHVSGVEGNHGVKRPCPVDAPDAKRICFEPPWPFPVVPYPPWPPPMWPSPWPPPAFPRPQHRFHHQQQHQQQQHQNSGARPWRPCTCRNSRCLQLYCACFAAQRMCVGCGCLNCQNNDRYPRERKAALEAARTRYRTDIICRCVKSKCLKKYCECFNAGVTCTAMCRCIQCENYPGGQNIARHPTTSLHNPFAITN